ncbi:MAG: pentapeptide repeat-containing protein [Bacteroidota bacterium]
MSSKQSEHSKIEERLKELEANLIEQEHRPLKLLSNYLNRKRQWGGDVNDVRRIAASRALIWRLFSSPTSVIIGAGSLVTLFTIYFLWQQNKLIQQQNDIVARQTEQLDIQSKLMESSRRSAQVFIMGEVLSDISEELTDNNNSARVLSDPLISRIIVLSRAMKPYYYFERDSLIDIALSPERAQLLIALAHMKIDSTSKNKIFFGANFTYSDLKNSYFLDADIRGARLKGSNLVSSSFHRSNMRGVHFDSVQMKFARMSDNDINTAVFDRIHADSSGFINSKIEGSIFIKSSFRGADFRNADLFLSSFYSMDFRNANFTDADLRYTEFEKGDLSGAKLSGCDLSYVRSLDSVKVQRFDWLEYIRDTLQLKGADRIYCTYKIDSIYYNEDDKAKRPIIVKRDIENLDKEPEFHLSYSGISYNLNKSNRTIQYNITSDPFSTSIYDFKLSYSTLLEYKENGEIKYIYSNKIANNRFDTIPANSCLKMKFDILPVDESNVQNFYVLFKGSFRSFKDGKLYEFDDLYQRNLSRLMVATKRLKLKEKEKVVSKMNQLTTP